MRKLTVNRPYLLDLIDADITFVSQLASPKVGCLTWPQRIHLVNIGQPRERNDKLLEFLTRRSVASFKQFTEALSKHQEKLVSLFVTDEGETFLTSK